MSNYSDNPSMDEILRRIKKALAERERRVEEEAFRKAEEQTPVSYEEMREYATRPDVTSKIVENVAKDEIFIKPNLGGEGAKDVFVLTKEMKVNNAAEFAGVDFHLLCSNLAKSISKDLAIAYMAPKIESWFINNFWDVVSESQKKN